MYIALYSILVLLLSIPFYLLNKKSNRLPANLPNSAIMVVVPMLLAILFSSLGWGISLDELFQTFKLDFSNQIFSILISIIMPLIIYIISRFIFREKMNSQEKPLNIKANKITLGSSFRILFFYLLGATIEEIGWTSYATQIALEEGWSVFATAIVVAIVWQLWHLVPFKQMGRTNKWILFHSLTAVAYRIMMTYLFVHTNGSIYPEILIHTMINFAPELFPEKYEGYDPLINCIVASCSLVVFLILI